MITLHPLRDHLNLRREDRRPLTETDHLKDRGMLSFKERELWIDYEATGNQLF